MQYAIYTRGINKDYIWSQTLDDSAIHNFLSSNGVVVKRQPDGDFMVYLTSEPATRKDYIGRNITISCLIAGCSDWIAKGLTIYVLQNWDHFVNDFEKFVNNFGSDDWSVDEDAVKRFVSKHSISTTGKNFITRIENNNTNETRNDLLDELTKYDFSLNTGIKCIIDNGVLTGNDNLIKVRTETDVYLWTGGNKRILTEEDKPALKNVAKTDSARTTSKPKLPNLLFPKISVCRETVLRTILFILLAVSLSCNIYLITFRNNSLNLYEAEIVKLKKQVLICNDSARQWKERAELLSKNLDIVSGKIDKNFNHSNDDIRNLQKKIEDLIETLNRQIIEVQKLQQDQKPILIQNDPPIAIENF
ncbi:MAG: hypothetical protein LBK06_08020 [Planctomycetaceae bacterium]|jgi:hypothetical protein|nr:hypothetical protein [Planctomycetaceae bacterium]